jgi:membrane protease YdiL (CAAX protease family)
MVNIEPADIVQRVIASILAAMATCWCWLIFRLVTGQPVLPERSKACRREMPWHSGTILLVFFLYIGVSFLTSMGYRLVWDAAHEGPLPLSHLMFLNGLVMAILLILVPGAVTLTSGASLRDLGLRFDDWWRQAVHGVIAMLIAAPPIYAIQFAAARVWTPIEHPVSEMIKSEFSVGVGWLAVATAVVLAPMFEELVFRAILQGWLVGLLERDSRSWPNSSQIAAADRGWLGIVLTALLFGYVHVEQWPAPIALFVLALVVGTVYDRTGSLITAVAMHATFNGISTAMLFAGVLLSQKLEPDKAKERVSAGLHYPVERVRWQSLLAIECELPL